MKFIMQQRFTGYRKVDEGDIAFEESIRFDESDTALSMYQKSLHRIGCLRNSCKL